MSNLTVRILSALVMAAVSLTAMVADTRSRWAVFALFLSLAGWEWARMLRAKFGGPKVEILSGAVVLLSALAYLPGSAVAGPAWTWGLCCASVLVFTVIGFRSLDITAMAPWIYLNLFGLAYLGLYASAIFDLAWPYAGWKGVYPFLMVLILIAAADTGAYFTGRKFGKVKLAPTISSGKTREGAMGGAAATTLLSLLLAPHFLGTSWAVNLGLGLLMG